MNIIWPVVLDTTLLFLQLLKTDAGPAKVAATDRNTRYDEEAVWFWDVYPGTNQFTPMRAVKIVIVFSGICYVTFSGITNDSLHWKH